MCTIVYCAIEKHLSPIVPSLRLGPGTKPAVLGQFQIWVRGSRQKLVGYYASPWFLFLNPNKVSVHYQFLSQYSAVADS